MRPEVDPRWHTPGGETTQSKEAKLISIYITSVKLLD